MIFLERKGIPDIYNFYFFKWNVDSRSTRKLGILCKKIISSPFCCFLLTNFTTKYMTKILIIKRLLIRMVNILFSYVLGALINHSCNPNCYAHQTYPGLKEDERSAFSALPDVQPDEEITVNYNLFRYNLPSKTTISSSSSILFRRICMILMKFERFFVIVCIKLFRI